MEKLLELLKEVCPSVDFTSHALVDDGLIDSLDIVTIITALSDEYDIEIPVEEIVPENFNSAAQLLSMVERLVSEE